MKIIINYLYYDLGKSDNNPTICISSNKIPDEWKIAFATPVLKPKAPKSSLDSYRPISVITPITKVFEMIIEKQIRTYIEAKNMLNDAQFGFRKRWSCELAIDNIVVSWKISHDLKKFIIALFLDLSKAFDTVQNQLIIEKLVFYNFSNNSIELIKNYLSNRFNIVK